MGGLLGAAFVLFFSTPVWASTAKASTYYEDALKRFETKDFAGAEIQLKNALREDSKWLPALTLMGRASLANGNPAAAEAAYMSALEYGASRSEIVLLLGQTLALQGKHAQLLQDPRLQPEGLPSLVTARLHLLRAATQIDIGNDRQASQSIAAAKALHPELPEIWLTEVTQKIRTQQWEAAQASIDQAAKLAPGSVDVLYQRAALHHVRNRLPAALADYQAVLAQSPKHLEALIASAGIALDLGRLDLARSQIASGRAIEPQEPRLAYLGALVAEAKGEREAALAALREVTNLIDGVPPEFIRFRPQALMLAGLAHQGLGQSEKARPYLEMVVKQQPRSPANKLLAQSLMDLGQTENALTILETYLKVQPQDFQALAMLAAGHSAVGRHAKATQLMNQALASRDAPQLRAVLGEALMRAGKLDAAEKELENVWKRHPNSMSAGIALTMLHLRNQQGAKALGVARPLAAAHPRQASLQHLLGMAQEANGDVQSARTGFTKALELDRNLIEPQLSLARLDAKAGHFKKAAERLEDLVRRQPKLLEPMFELANLALRQRDSASASRWLERAMAEAGPKDQRAHMAMMNLRLRNKQFAEALAVAKTMSERAPDAPPVLMAYGQALIANGDVKGARAPLNNASRRVGDDAPALLEVGSLLLAAQDPAAASYTLAKVLELQPRDAEALALQVRANLQLGELEGAERHLRQLSALRPRDARTHLLAADLAATRRQPDAMLAAVRKAYEVQPSTDTVLKWMQASRQQDRSGAAAQSTAEAWLRQHPKDGSVLHALAELHVQRQQLPAAKLRYEQLLKLNPRDARALNNLALAQLQEGDTASALRNAEAASKAAPTQPIAQDTLAWVLHKRGEHDKALGLLREARLRAPDNAEIRYHLASVLTALGRKSEARIEINAALAQPQQLESTAAAKELSQQLR